MKPRNNESQYTVFKDELISFSSKALIEIIKAIFDKGLDFRFEVTGFSMMPFVRCKDIVTLKPLLNSSLRIGDIAAFIHPQTNKLIIHRVISRQYHNYIIKGDNILNVDGVIHKDSILGKVSKIERRGKTVFLNLGQERFLIVLLSRINIFCALYAVLRFIRGIKYE